MADAACSSGSLYWRVTEADGLVRILGTIRESVIAESTLRVESEGRVAGAAFIHGSVDEQFRGRGLGTAMLTWAAAVVRGTSRAPAAAGATLRIDVADAPLDAVDLFKANGFELAVAEDEMECEIAAAPGASLRPHMSVTPWCAETAPEFFRVYKESFCDRPGFPGWSEAQWRAAFTCGAGFRPDLSLLLRSAREPIAYALCDVATADTAAIGAILQMGAIPTWRGRGVADRVIAAVFERFRAEGLSKARLSVNVNNPRARRAYERVGFRAIGQYQSYRKLLD